MRISWRAAIVFVTLGVFAGGLLIGLHLRQPPAIQGLAAEARPAELDPGTAAAKRPRRPADSTTPRVGRDPIADLRGRQLDMPVQGMRPEQLHDSFDEARSAGRHEAIDILAPRNTPVLAVEDGTIAKLYTSRAGGLTIYQFDPAVNFAYYYAHLERYAPGLQETAHIRRGDTIGYVGTTGNAPKETPHLHFAIYRLTDQKHWWEGAPINPYEVLRTGGN